MAEQASVPLNIFGTSPVPTDALARSRSMRSRLDHYFEMSVFLLLTAGFVTITTTGAVDFLSITFVLLALLVRGWFLLAGKNLSMPRSWDPYFTFGYVGLYAVDYFFFARGFVNATVHLVLFSMVVKIFSVRRDRDHVYLTVLAFMEVLAASVLTVDSLFLAAFTLFMVLAINTFVAFEIRRSWSTSTTHALDSPATEAYAQGHMSRSLLSTSAILLLGIALIATGVFFVLPRVTIGYFGRFVPQNRIESGFTENVQLGRIGEIQQSDSVAMHIEIVGDKTGFHDLKWRGISLSSFDGNRWSNMLRRDEAIPELAGCFNVIPRAELHSGYVCTPGATANANVIRYRVLMEPIGTNVFFLAPKPRSLFGRYQDVRVDGSGAVFNTDLNHPIDVYEATSDLSSPSPEQLRASANFYPAAIAALYLKYPANLDPRIEQLAKHITASANNPYDKAAAIEQYLQTNYAYTLKLSQVAPKDPVSDFLFERKAGHCEYFASAMAIMLRTIEIPARIVNGFRGGEFNYVSGKYIVRARDAHSWVEVYFPGSGWVSFDPTPAGAAPSDIEHSRVGLYLDAMRDFWREWIINYDFGHQSTLSSMGTTRIVSSAEQFRKWIKHHYMSMILRGLDLRNHVARRPARWLYGAVIVAVFLLLLINLPRLVKFLRTLRFIKNPAAAPNAAATLWYARMTKVVGQRGLMKSPSQTPSEFTASISDPVLRSSVALFTTHYHRARFADSASDAQRLPSLFQMIRTVARQR